MVYWEITRSSYSISTGIESSGRKRRRLVEDRRHFAGLDAVVVVLADPDLELAGSVSRSVPPQSRKVFWTRPTSVTWKETGTASPSGRRDAEMAVGVLGEQGFEFGEVHEVAVGRWQFWGRGSSCSRAGRGAGSTGAVGFRNRVVRARRRASASEPMSVRKSSWIWK